MRVGTIEYEAVSGQLVDGRRPHVLVAVDWQVIGPERIDRDEDNWLDRPGSRAQQVPAGDDCGCQGNGHGADDHQLCRPTRVLIGARSRGFSGGFGRGLWHGTGLSLSDNLDLEIHQFG
jgi:hypothetical protein